MYKSMMRLPMMKMRFLPKSLVTLALGALACLPLLSGCSGMRESVRLELPGTRVAMSPEHAVLYREVAGASPVIRTMEGYADIVVEERDRRKRLYSSVNIQRGRVVRMIVSGGLLGLPVGDLFIGPDSMYVHDMLNDRYFVGSSSARNLEKLLGLDSGWPLLSGTLLGLVEITEPLGAVREVRGDGTLLSFVVASGEGSKELVVDPAAKTLMAIILRDAAGRMKAEVRFSDFRESRVEGTTALVPADIDIAMPGLEGEGNRRLRLVYDERSFNGASEIAGFSIPQGARVYSLDAMERLPWM